MIPPKYAQRNAKRALECLNKGSKAMTSVGRKRAMQLANRESLSNKDLKDISSFRRHYENAKYRGNICEDKGAVAWMGWGYGFNKGKPIKRFAEWAERKLK